MDFKHLTDKAKGALDKRGGIDGLKADALRVKDAASKPGSVKERAEAARDALKEQPPTPEATDGEQADAAKPAASTQPDNPS